ncbi:MAG: hypothetical protein P8Y70_04065 [Candidatus Lokiarchaeota archaeon]
MKYCPVCENILYPKNHKLYCKACNKTYILTESQKRDYKNFKVLETKTSPNPPDTLKQIEKNDNQL